MTVENESLRLAMYVDRALRSGDGNEIIKTVTTFMEHTGLRADIDVVMRIPSTARPS